MEAPMRTLIIMLAGLLLAPSEAGAQARTSYEPGLLRPVSATPADAVVTTPGGRVVTTPADRVATTPADAVATTPQLVLAGAGGATVGLLLGTAVIGIPLGLALPATDDELSTPGFIAGSQIGQAVATAAAVHLANGRRGNFRQSFYNSLLIAAAGTALLWTGDLDSILSSHRPAVLVAVPLIQLMSAIHTERAGAAPVR
jgi:hypothetical protein